MPGNLHHRRTGQAVFGEQNFVRFPGQCPPVQPKGGRPVHTHSFERPQKGGVGLELYNGGKQRRALVPARRKQRIAVRPAAERRGLLNRVYRGSAGQMVAAFLKEETLTAQERDELRRLLDEMEV